MTSLKRRHQNTSVHYVWEGTVITGGRAGLGGRGGYLGWRGPCVQMLRWGGMCGGGMTAGEWVLDHTFYATVETHPSMPELYTKLQEVQ